VKQCVCVCKGRQLLEKQKYLCSIAKTGQTCDLLLYEGEGTEFDELLLKSFIQTRIIYALLSRHTGQ
jgi:hypothetical protein